jgi:hypothetical protein
MRFCGAQVIVRVSRRSGPGPQFHAPGAVDRGAVSAPGQDVTRTGLGVLAGQAVQFHRLPAGLAGRAEGQTVGQLRNLVVVAVDAELVAGLGWNPRGACGPAIEGSTLTANTVPV